MRRGELLGLTWDRVHLDQRTAFLAEDRRTGEPRTVHLNDRVVEEFRALPNLPRTPKIFDVPPSTLHYNFRNACTDLGLSDLRFHDTRHTFCSRLMELWANLRAVQALAHHKQISMTMRYARLQDNHLGETVKPVNGEPGRNLGRSLEPSRERG